MPALVDHGPGQLTEILQAHDTFGHAADTRALKVIKQP
jgi:hypothetical protein